MYCKIEQRVNPNEHNYQSYTKEEFIRMINDIAYELGVLDLPHIIFFDESDPIGYCKGVVVGHTYTAISLGFNTSLLNGLSHSNLQIREVIKHELSHLIANRKYNADCSHDLRWKEVAISSGCDTEEYLCLTKFYANIRIDKVENIENKKHWYYLECSQCKKEQLRSNSNGMNILAFSLMSMEKKPFPITLGKLNIRTNCCDTPYSFVGKAIKIVEVLKKGRQLDSVRKILEEMLAVE